jgi:predicted acetylornithine/succinylornithine family transaminase
VSLEELVARADAALMPTYRRQPVAFVRGRGQYLYDVDGREYLDCMAGISMINVGHAHPAVTAAIAQQAAELVNCSNLYYTEPQIALAEWIRGRSIGGKVFFCNSGAEANEAALKLARRYGGGDRTEVVAITDGFHGRTMGALSLTGQPSKQEPFAPLVPGVRHVERDDHDGLEAAVSERTCAIFLETIQGEVGVHPLAPAFIRLARELATRHGALLVIDEIQTGLSRTGPLFSYQELDVVPDVMCLAKSLGGGVPIGAIVAAPAFADTLRPGDHGSTFAGGPLACAAALAACNVLDDAGLQDHVRSVGGRLLTGLKAFVADGLASAARGRGLMCGLDLPTARAADVVADLLAGGFLANNTSERTLRFLPPLVIQAQDVDRLLAALGQALERCSER